MEPTLMVYRDPDTGLLAWKAKDVHGARWQGKCRDMAEVAAASEEAVPSPAWIEFVTEKV